MTVKPGIGKYKKQVLCQTHLASKFTVFQVNSGKSGKVERGEPKIVPEVTILSGHFCRLLDANLPDHLDVGQTHHDLFHSIHLQCAHAAFHRRSKNGRHAGALLNQPLDVVGGDQ